VADCLFCRIVAGEIPADVVRSTEDTLAFRDIEPQAPTHVLVIPRAHFSDVGTLVSDPQLTARLIAEAAAVAAELGHEQYRLVLNTGAQAGQSVFHVHAHVLAGRDMRWPPG
jgi:histidine triad (HIT) family protein